MTGDTQKIVNVISKDVREPKDHQKTHFKIGFDYLLEDMSEVSMNFFEKYFAYLSLEEQESVLDAYNTRELFFKSQKDLLSIASKGNTGLAFRTYINRLDANTFELALIEVFGKEPTMTQDVVTRLYHIANMYDAKLPLNKFKVSIYELMKFPQMGTEDSMASKLLDVIEPKAVHNVLFMELKTQEIDVDTLNTWIDILNRKKVISTQEYAGFTNSYNSVRQLREEYVQLERQEVDIKNIKEKIDVQTSEYLTKIEKITSEITSIQTEMTSKKSELAQKTNYETIELYIMDYDQESGVYEASIPEKSWFFGTYKPSNEKVKITLTDTKPESQGVYTFNVYNNGQAGGIPYYIEVSSQAKAQIKQLQDEINNQRASIEKKEAEKNQLAEEVNKIRKANNYDQNNRLLEEVNNKKESVLLKVKEKQIEIQTLFGIGNVTIKIADKK